MEIEFLGANWSDLAQDRIKYLELVNKLMKLNTVHFHGKLKTSKWKQLIFKTLLFADAQFIISDTEDKMQKAVYVLYNISKNIIWKLLQKDEGIWFRWDRSPKNKIYYKRWKNRES